MDKKVLFSVLDEVAIKHSDNIAIEENDRHVTYKSLIGYSNSVANCLLTLQLQKGQEVGLFLNCGINYLASILGVNKGGGIFMALDTEYPIKRMEYILDHVKPPLIITDDEQLPKLLYVISKLDIEKAFLKKIIVISGTDQEFKIGHFLGEHFELIEKRYYSTEKVDLIVNGEDSMYLVNTSGSTGNPKIIEGWHKSLSHFIHWEVAEFNLDETTRGCILARLSFDLSLREMFAPLLAGGTLCIPNPEIKTQPAKLVHWLRDKKINLIHPIPSIFRLLLKEIQNNTQLDGSLNELKNILFAGEALFGRDITDWLSVGGYKASLANLYGPSETTIAKVCYRIKDNDFQPNEIIPLGVPLPNTSILIISDNLLCSSNIIGEIYIKTPFRSKGYYKEPEMTNLKFIQNPLHNEFEDIVYQTGDLGKYLSDGTIAFVGRQDSQVKIRGNRVELTEVERAILRYTDVKQTIVLPIKKSDDDFILTCYYLSDAYVNNEALRSYLKDYLPEYMIPSFYLHLNEFPLNLNGKIDKKALPKPEDLLYDQLAYEAPQSELEIKLCNIWADVLNLKKVGITNSFYELGGHSLSVTKVLSRIYKELEIEITLRDIFDNSTVKALSKFLETKSTSNYISIMPVGVQEVYDLSFSQKSLWILHQLEGQSIAYNIPSSFMLYGPLDIDCLQKSLNFLIKRHETLRTTFIVENGEPKQKVNNEILLKIKYNDEANNPDTEEDIIDKHIAIESAKYITLDEGPLFRVTITKLAIDKHFMMFTIHHIISDGLSRSVAISELFKLYNAFKRGAPSPLPPLGIQYKDYVAWQSQFLKGQKLESLRKFWITKLNQDVTLVNFPADKLRAKQLTSQGGTVYFELDMATSKKLYALNKTYQTTEFISFLTCIKILLFKYTGQKDLIIGTPVAGREHLDLENQIGIYVNILPIITHINADETFEDLLTSVRKTVLEAYEYQHYPFELMVQDMNLSGKDKTLPLIDVLVRSQPMVLNDDSKLDEIYVKALPADNGTSKVDLTFDISPNTNNTNTISIEFSKELYNAETIEGVKRNLLHIISRGLDDPSLLVSDINLLPGSLAEEQEYLRYKESLQNL